MIVFNLITLLLLLIAAGFPTLQQKVKRLYVDDLGMMPPEFTLWLLNPAIAWILLGVATGRLWVHANRKVAAPSEIETYVTVGALLLFIILCAVGFVLPLWMAIRFAFGI
jgi:hypothetical protein